MNAAYVEGRVVNSDAVSVWLAVPSYHPTERRDVVRVHVLDWPATWWVEGTRAAFSGRLRRSSSGLYLEATDCWLDGVLLVSDRSPIRDADPLEP